MLKIRRNVRYVTPFDLRPGTVKSHTPQEAETAMLTIRTAQLVAIRRARALEFSKSAARLMTQCWPEFCAGMDTSELMKKVDRGIESARHFRVSGDRALCGYLNVWFAMGGAFPWRPGDEWAREILSRTDQTSSVRIDQLATRAAEILTALARGEDVACLMGK